MSLGNSRVSLVTAVKDLSKAKGVSSMPRKFFVGFIRLSLFLNVFGARNSPVYFVKETHLLPL